MKEDQQGKDIKCPFRLPGLLSQPSTLVFKIQFSLKTSAGTTYKVFQDSTAADVVSVGLVKHWVDFRCLQM